MAATKFHPIANDARFQRMTMAFDSAEDVAEVLGVEPDLVHAVVGDADSITPRDAERLRFALERAGSVRVRGGRS
jgi:hypothetical protein